MHSVNRFSDKPAHDSLCLNEIRTNLAANLGRSPLTHSYGYGPAGDRPTLFVRGVPKQRVPQGGGQDARSSFVPFMLCAG